MVGIYKIENLINHKVYVGQSVNIKHRWFCHRRHLDNNTHTNFHLQKAWNKYGSENFKFEIIENCEKEFLNDRETYWNNYYSSLNGTYNIGATNYENTMSDEMRQRISKKLIGHKMSEESKQKMINKLKGRPGKNKGIPLSEELRKKISLKLKGKPTYKRTPELNLKMSKILKGHKISEETRLKISETLKRRNNNVKTLLA